MEFKEILRRRRSVRKYLSRPVEREVLDTVLREALAAPSSRNSHSTHLRVLTDPETIARIARMRDYGSAFLEHAPAVVLVEGDRTATDLWRENAAITATALLFAATGAGLLLGACERTSLFEGSARRSAGGRLSAGVPSRPGGARHPVRRRSGLLRLRACGPAPVRCGNAYPLAGKVAGPNRVRVGRVSGRTSFGRFMSFAGTCIGNPAGFDFLGLNLSFSRRKSGSSNKKTATVRLRFFCFGTPCHFLLKRFIVRSGPIAANERIASPKYLSRSGIALRSSSFQCPST
jgi:nitroreductase